MTDEAKSSYVSGFVAVVGRTNAGKSTLVNALVGSKVSIVTPKSQTTRDRVMGVKHLPGGQIVFVDTPGFVSSEHRNSLGAYLENQLRDAATSADLTMVIIDSVKLQAKLEGAAEIANEVKRRGAEGPFLVVLNKIDLLDKRELLPIINVCFAEFSQLGSCEVIPVSAKTNDGLAELEALVMRYLPEGPQYFPVEMTTDKPLDYLVAEVIREKLYLRYHQELPYGLAVSIEEWTDYEDLVQIAALIQVAKASHKPMIIGESGASLKSVGRDARLEIESMLKKKVFLELFVRVTEEWNNSSKGLQRVGYEN